MEILNKYIYDPKKDVIGKGGFSTVFKAYDKLLDLPVALKFFHVQDIKSKYNIASEIKRVIKLSHPNIIKFYGIETLTNTNFHGEEEEMQIGVMELAEFGQVNIYFKNHKLSKDQIKVVFIGVLEGLKYLHSQGIIHRDIKPQNILLSKDHKGNLIPKIADFGISKNVDASQTSASMLLGTVEYMAPEQFNPDKYGISKKISFNVDVWAFGVMTYFLLSNEFIFGGKSAETSPGEIINKIINLHEVSDKLSKIDEPFRSLIQKCLVPDANIRTSDVDELIAILKEEPYKPQVSLSTKPAKKESEHEVIIGSDSIKSGKSSQPDDSDETKILSPFSESSSDETKILPKPISNKIQESAPAYDFEENRNQDKGMNLGALLAGKNLKYIAMAAGVLVVGLVSFFALNKNEHEEFKPLIERIEANMKKMPKGSFSMGSKESIPECECNVELSIEIPQNFKILSTEVTQSMWNELMKDNRFKDKSLADFPANNVTWNDTQRFLKKLNEVAETTDANKFRLPSESEWEYCAIGDQSFSKMKEYINDFSWNVNNTKTLQKVKTKKPNINGIFDMYGNAYEWCDNWFNANDKDKLKVLRGGDYKNAIELVDPYCRNRDFPNNTSETIGFRIVQNNNIQ